MNLVKAVLLKVLSALIFALMWGLIRWLGGQVPLGEMVFFRSACGIIPVVVIYAWRRELAAAVRTSRPLGHVGRGLISVAAMFSNFGALTRLPLADATAISFVTPLVTVALAALILKERVRVYRWSAVGVGFIGVMVTVVPHLSPGQLAGAGAIGSALALIASFCNAGTVIQTRRLTTTETTSSIVFYFSLFVAMAGLLTLPFAWHTPDAKQLGALVLLGILGGLGHIILTESYRFAPASVIAPFDYTAMLWAFLVGYAMFGELPHALVYVGSAIVAGAGLFVIWRERRLGLQRVKSAEGPPTPA